jgi:integrase
MPITVRQAIEDYLLYLATEGRRPKTLVRYRGELYAWRDFLETQGATRLSQISPVLFDKFRQTRKADHSLRTLFHEAVVLKQFVKWCKSRKLIAQNPLEEVKLLKPEREPQRAFTLEQVETILKHSRGQRLIQNAIAAFAGLREGQICLLRPEDVDLQGDWIRIKPVSGAKTQREVKVPIHPRLKLLLGQLSKKPRPWLFTSPPSRKYPRGDHWVNPKRLYECVMNILKKLSLPLGQKNGGYTFHSFRRFFRTFTTNAGVPREVVDRWMGHRSDKSMANVYYDLTDEVSQAFMQKVPFGNRQTGGRRR